MTWKESLVVCSQKTIHHKTCVTGRLWVTRVILIQNTHTPWELCVFSKLSVKSARKVLEEQEIHTTWWWKQSESSPATSYSFLCRSPTFTVLLRKPVNPLPPPPVTFQVLGVKKQKSANPADCVSPFAWPVTYQTIPGFSTTGPGNNGELSMEAAALCVQSPTDTSPLFKKRAAIYLALYLSGPCFDSSHLFPPVCK